jgi:hypothetical protein
MYINYNEDDGESRRTIDADQHPRAGVEITSYPRGDATQELPHSVEDVTLVDVQDGAPHTHAFQQFAKVLDRGAVI